MEYQSEKGRILKANRLLQAKVGIGPVDEKKVEKSQKIIEQTQVDFAPMAAEFVTELNEAIDAAKKAKPDDRDAIEKMAAPVMQLKANGRMFGYDLVTSLATIILNFLETIDRLDKDVIDIVEANKTTISAIISNKMEGDGGTDGQALVAEIRDACKRYFAKQATRGKDVDDKNHYFIGEDASDEGKGGAL